MGPHAFVGHVGDDDVVVIVPPGLVEEVAATICERFDEQAPGVYDSVDAQRPRIDVRDRQGNVKAFPLLSISTGIATSATRIFQHVGEVVAVATEMKQVAKRDTASSFAPTAEPVRSSAVLPPTRAVSARRYTSRQRSSSSGRGEIPHRR